MCHNDSFVYDIFVFLSPMLRLGWAKCFVVWGIFITFAWSFPTSTGEKV